MLMEAPRGRPTFYTYGTFGQAIIDGHYATKCFYLDNEVAAMTLEPNVHAGIPLARHSNINELWIPEPEYFRTWNNPAEFVYIGCLPRTKLYRLDQLLRRVKAAGYKGACIGFVHRWR